MRPPGLFGVSPTQFRPVAAVARGPAVQGTGGPLTPSTEGRSPSDSPPPPRRCRLRRHHLGPDNLWYSLSFHAGDNLKLQGSPLTARADTTAEVQAG